MDAVLLAQLKAARIDWSPSPDEPYVFVGSFGEVTLTLRMNDFPEEVMFTLLANGEEIDEFNDRPVDWHLTGS